MNIIYTCFFSFSIFITAKYFHSFVHKSVRSVNYFFLGTLFSVSDGMNYGWTAPMTLYLISPESHIPATLREAEFLEILYMAGSVIGLPVTIFLVNKIGRKKSLILAAVVNLVGWIVLGVADRLIYIQIFRVLFGMAGDMAFVAGPMYIAEIADQKIRGFLSSIIYLMMLVGFIIIYSVGPYSYFFVPPIIAGILMIIDLIIFGIFMPESPYYLIINNKYEDAKNSLQYFRPNRDIKDEFDEIVEAVERQKSETGRIQDMFLVKKNRRAITIVVTLNVGQHVAGISVILMNFHVILEAAGSIYLDTSVAAIIFALLMLIAAAYASFQIDKYGRKVLLIISSVTTGLCLLSLAIYFNLKHAGYDVKSVSWIPIVSVMIYAGTFKLGLGIVPIVVTAEIFSAKMKAMGMTASDGMYVIAAIISVEIYQWLTALSGMHLPFYVFALSTFAIVLFTVFYIPETKGKTLEEIQMLLKGKRYLEEYKHRVPREILNQHVF